MTGARLDGSTAGRQYGTQAVERAARLLAVVVDAGKPVASARLASVTGLPRSTVSRLMLALERGRLVSRDECGRFVPGAMFTDFAAQAAANPEETA
jgi:IclR family transcriptional regulator, acetate operon repressor